MLTNLLYATTKLNKTVRTKNQTTDMIFAFFWHKNEEFKNYASKFLVNSANCIGCIAYFKYGFLLNEVVKIFNEAIVDIASTQMCAWILYLMMIEILANKK